MNLALNQYVMSVPLAATETVHGILSLYYMTPLFYDVLVSCNSGFNRHC